MPASITAILCAAAVLAGVTAPRAGQPSPATPDHWPGAGDSVVIRVTNSMPHPWDFFADTSANHPAIGHVDANAATRVVIHDVQGDSVTLYAVSFAMGQTSRRFASHGAAPQDWAF
jgi:hypothetical protein